MNKSVILVKEEQRKVAKEHSSDKQGRLIEVLHAEKRGMMVFVGTIAPGGQSDGFAIHDGEEFAFILEGELKYSVDGKSYYLKAGDFIYYPSSLPHGYENTSEATTKVLWGETVQR